MGKFFRNFRHVAEHRKWASFADDIKEYEPILRYHMRRKALSEGLDPWDDRPRKDINDRTWKRHRNKQYKVKKSKEKRCSKKFGEHMARRDHRHRIHRFCMWKPCRQCREDRRNGARPRWWD